MSVQERRGPPGPAYLTRFVGRTDELGELKRIVSSCRRQMEPGSRLVTVVGAGGSGKTRLAARLVEDLTGSGARAAELDGCSWVDLAPLPGADHLPRTLAVALALPASTPDPTAALIRALQESRALIILDNCEEMTRACEQLATDLLTACRHLMIIATSRTPLHLAGSVTYPVTPLSQTPRPAGPDGLGRSEAAELFYDRAGLVAPAYSASDADDTTIDTLCRRLDGVPLAIELAAPWIRVLSARDLLARTEQSLDVLASTVGEDRHRSMRAVLESSWHGLSHPEQQVMRTLGTFVGGFSLEGAEAVARATLADLATLTERSLITREPQADGGTRYGMHEVVRQYAVERLLALDDAELIRVRRGHLDYLVGLAEAAKAAWATDEETLWLERLRQEDANVNAALAWALDHREAEAALRLCAATFRVWIYSAPPGHYGEVVERALALPWDGDSAVAALARARTLHAAAYAADEVGDLARGARYFSEAITLAQRVGDDDEHAACLRGYSYTVGRMGDHRDAERYARRSLDLCQRTGDRTGEAWSYKHLAEEAFALGDLEKARRRSDEGAAAFEQLGNTFGSYCSAVFLGNIQVCRGDWPAALEAYALALELRSRSGFAVNGGEILDGLARVALAVDRPDRAATLFGAGHGDAWGHERWDEPAGGDDTGQTTAQKRLGDAWDGWFEAGRLLPSAQVMATAVEAVAELRERCAEPPAGLTAREIEVIRLVAQGLGSAEVADQLSLSPRTVHAHLRSVFGKLGVTSRTGAAHEAARLGLL